MSKLGADDFSGYSKKSTETNEQATGTGNDDAFGEFLVKDGKACLNNEITKQVHHLDVPNSGIGGVVSVDASDDATDLDGHGQRTSLVEDDYKSDVPKPSGAQAPTIVAADTDESNDGSTAETAITDDDEKDEAGY